MVRGLIRWANSLHLDALTGFLTGAIPLSLGLWATAVFNWPLGSVTLMGIAAAVLIVVYTAPLTLGFTALATRFNLKSIGELFLTLWIVIACFGGIAIFDGLVHIGSYYPVHIFFLSLAIAAGLRSSVVNLDFWMKVIAIFATVLMILVTIAAIPKHVMTSGVAGPEAVAAADARNQAARKAADDAQKSCIDVLPGNYTSDQAYKACPLKLGTEPAPQAPRELTLLEQDVFKLSALNKGALDTEATTCVRFLQEIVDGYTENDGTKVAGRSLNDSDYATNEFCSAKSLAVIKKLQKNVQVPATTVGFAARQEEVINTMANTLPDWMPDWAKVALAWTLALVAAHGVYFAIAAGIVALLVALGLRKKSIAVATTTSKITAKASTGSGWKTLAVLLIIGVVGYFAWNNPTVSAGVKGGLLGASRGMTAAETPVWNKFLTRDFVKGHGTKAFVGGAEYDVVLDDNGRISLQQNGNEMYAMGQLDPCSEAAPTKLADGTPLTAATCSGRWKAGGSAYGTSYGVWVGKLNATYSGMIRVAYLSYSTDPSRAPVEVWFR